MDAPSSQGWGPFYEESPGFRGLVMWNVRTNQRRVVRSSPGGYAAFDGRYLLYQEITSTDSYNRFSIFSYDLVTGRLKQLGASLPAGSATPYPSPWQPPLVQSGTGIWLQGYSPTNAEVAVADLASGTVRYDKLQTFGNAQFYPGGLLLGGLSATGATHRALLSLTTGALGRTPPALMPFEGKDLVSVAPDGALTWSGQGGTELWYAASPTAQPSHVATFPAENGLQGAATGWSADGFIYPVEGVGSFYVDRRTGTAVKVSATLTTYLRAGTVISSPPGAKGASSNVIDIATLPAGALGTCPVTPTSPPPGSPAPLPPAPGQGLLTPPTPSDSATA